MSSPGPFATPNPPAIPLADDVRKAYQDLNNTLQAAIEGTTNAAALEALNTAQAQVDDVLTKDAMFRLHANTALFNALLTQINQTNDELQTLQNQIQSITTGFNRAGEILAAINKVLSFIPGI